MLNDSKLILQPNKFSVQKQEIDSTESKVFCENICDKIFVSEIIFIYISYPCG